MPRQRMGAAQRKAPSLRAGGILRYFLAQLSLVWNTRLLYLSSVPHCSAFPSHCADGKKETFPGQRAGAQPDRMSADRPGGQGLAAAPALILATSTDLLLCSRHHIGGWGSMANGTKSTQPIISSQQINAQWPFQPGIGKN